MKQDWNEAFRYYKNTIDFPNTNSKIWCDWYQESCRFFSDEIKAVKKLSLLQQYLNWIKR